MLERVSKLLRKPLLWKVTGFVSGIVGFICFALGPSFEELFGQWNLLKIYIYIVVASLLSILILFARPCKRGLLKSSLVKAQVAFLVLMLTSLCSYLEDRSEQGKEEKGYGRKLYLASTFAFACMALSFSRLLQPKFEVGVFNFFLGCFLVTVMKMNLKWSPLAALFCYLLINVRSITGFLEKKLAIPILPV